MQIIALQQHSVERVRFQELIIQEMIVRNTPINTGVKPYVTFGDMELKIPLKNGKMNYEVDVDSNGASDADYELKLDDGVFFYPVGVAFYLFKKSDENGMTNWVTNPDPEIFSPDEVTSLSNLFYGSTHNFKIGGKEVWKNVSSRHALYVPGRMTQLAAETGASFDRPAQFGCGQCGQGYWDMWNEVALEGGKSSKYTLTLGNCNTLDFLQGEESDICLVVAMKGFYYCPDNQTENGFCRVN